MIWCKGYSAPVPVVVLVFWVEKLLFFCFLMRVVNESVMGSWDHSFFSHIRTTFKDSFGIVILINAIFKILFFKLLVFKIA
jgi:hypothetical protein